MTAISPGATPLYGSRGRHNGLTEMPASQPVRLSRPAGQVQRPPSPAARLRALASSQLPSQHLARPHLEPRGAGTPPGYCFFYRRTIRSHPRPSLGSGPRYSARGMGGLSALPTLRDCRQGPDRGPRSPAWVWCPRLPSRPLLALYAQVAAGFEADPVVERDETSVLCDPVYHHSTLPFGCPSIGCYGVSMSFPRCDNKLRSHIAPCNEAHHIGAPWRTQDGSQRVNLSLAPSTHCGVVFLALPSKPLTRKAWATLNGVR